MNKMSPSITISLFIAKLMCSLSSCLCHALDCFCHFVSSIFARSENDVINEDAMHAIQDG